MKTDFNREQMLELMRDFYTLSGIRIVLFDDEYNELLSYPGYSCPFCTLMKSDVCTAELCAASDRLSFRRSAAEKKLIVYHCHAGLIEATIPLYTNNVVIGYLMFGQISDADSERKLRAALTGKLGEYGIDCGDDIARGIPIKKEQDIRAAAKIMEACTFYVLLNQTVTRKRHHFSHMLREFLLGHLDEKLNSEQTAKALGISRSKLYQQCQQYLGMGIGEYLKKLRMERAETLLKDTDLSVTEISGKVGFSDYNYFCRVFKRETGVSAQKYRETFR